MKNPSDKDHSPNSDLPLGDDWVARRDAILGLGADSVHKSHYSSLRERLTELERFRSLLDMSSDLLFVLDLTTGRICDVNQTACSQLGHERASLLETPFVEIFDEQQRPAVAAALREVGDEAGGSTALTIELVASDGRRRSAELAMREVTTGGASFVVVSARDVTERLAAERELREKEELYRVLVENIDLGITLINADHEVVTTNLRQGGMFEKPGSEFIGRKCHEEFEKRGHICPHCPGTVAMATGQKAEVETQGVRDDGSRFDVRLQAFPVCEPDGTISGFIEVVEDITQRKAAEATLRLTQATVDHAADALYWYGSDGVFVYVNQAACDALGYGKEELLQLRVVDIDADLDERAFAASWVEVKRTGERFLESRHRRKDGSIFPVEIRVSHLEMGDRVLHCAFCRDITERKRAEESLRMTQAAVDTTADAVYWVRPDGTFEYVNQAACNSLGYSKEELLQLRVFDINVASDSGEQPFINSWAEVQRVGERLMESRHRRKDGGTFPVEVRACRVEMGNRELHCSFCRDITERKQAEERLRMTQAAVDHAADAFFWVRPDATFEYVNRAACDSLGYSKEELLQLRVFDIDLDFDEDMWKGYWAELKRHGHLLFEIRLRTKDGRIIPAEIRTNYVEFGGREYNFAFARDITERRQAEKALQESETRYRAIFETAKDGILLMKDDRFVECNPEMTRLFGASEEEILNRTPGDFSPPFQPDGRESKEASHENIDLALNGHSHHFEWKTQQLDGTLIDVEIALNHVDLPSGRHLHAILRDITERKRTEEALRMTQAAADNAADALFWVRPDATFEYVNRAACECLDYSEEELLRLRVFDIDLNYDEETWKGYWERLKRHGHLLFETRLQTKDGRIIPAEIRTNYVEFGGREYNFAFARDITQRKQAEEALQESETRYRAIFEVARDGVFLIKDGHYVDCNPATEAMVRASKEEILGRTPIDFAPPRQPDGRDSKEKAGELIRLVVEGQPQRFEWRNQRADGTLTDIEVNLSPVDLPAGRHILGFARDITERKRTEERLQMTQASVDRAADAVHWISADGSFYYVNQAACELLGYSEEEMLQMGVLDIDPDLDMETGQKLWEELKRNGPQQVFERRHRRKDGSTFPVEVRSNYLEVGGEELSCVFVRDITERKQAEEAVRASTDRLNYALKGARMGTWEWDIQNDVVTWSPETERIFGLQPGQFEGTYEAYAAFAPPEARDGINEYVRTFLETSSEGDEMLYEQPIVRADGQAAWVEIRGTVFRSEQGQPVEMAGLCLDVTQRKQADDALREAEERFRLAAQTASDLICEWDFTTDELRWFGDIDAALGYELGEFPHTFGAWRQSIYPDDKTLIEQVIQRYQETYVLPEPVEYRISTKQGNHRHWTLKGKTVFDGSGKPCRLVGVCTDVTEQRQAEAAQRESEQRYRFLFENAGVLISVFDRDGVFLMTNNVAAQNLGGLPKDFIGRSLAELHPGEGHEYTERIRATIDSGVSTKYEDLVKFPAGDRWLMSLFHPLRDTEGNVFASQVISHDISDRKQAEAALRDSEQRYRLLFENAGAFVAVFDRNGVFLMLNNMAAQSLGGSPEDFVGKSLVELHPDQGHVYAERIRATIDSGLSVEHEDLVKFPSGDRWLLSMDHPVFDANGNIYAVQIISHDITERKRAEDELAETKALLAAAIEQSPAGIIIADAPDGRIRMANSAALEIRGGAAEPLVDISFESHSQNWQTFHADGTPFPAEDLPLAQALQTGRTCRNVDVIIRRSGGEERWILANAAPVKNAEGETVAAIAVFPDITDRKRAEEALLREKTFSETVLNSLPSVFCLYNRQGELLRWNCELERVTGFSDEELRGTHPRKLFAEEDHPRIMEAFEEAFEAGQVIAEANILSKDGHSTPYYFTGVRMMVDDAPHVIGMGIDVSEMKRAQAALQESEAQFRSVVEDLPGMLCRNQLNGIIEFVNNQYCRYFGKSREELVGHDFFELIPQEDRELVRSNLARLSAHNPLLVHEHRAIDAMGSVRYHRWTNRAICDERGRLLTIQAYGEDITERRRAEEALRESERMLATLMGNLPGMAYRCLNDPDWTMLFLSQGCMELTGYEPDALAFSRDTSYAALIHSEDQRAIGEVVSDAIAAGEQFTLIYRIVARSGEEKWVWEKGRQVDTTEDGVAILEGFIADITDRKRAEDELKLKTDSLEHSLNGFSIISEDGRFVYANKAYLDMWGYDSLDEIVGTSPAEHCQDPTIPERIIATLKREGGCEIEFTARRKDGSTFEVLMSAFLWRDEKGHEYYTGASLDITERKEAEKVIRESRERLLQIIDGSTIPTLIIDTNHTITHWNKAFETLIGVPAGEIGSTLDLWRVFYTHARPGLIDLLVDGADDQQIQAYYQGKGLRRVEETGAYEAEDFFSRVGKWLFFTAAVLRDYDGNIIGAMETFQDITDRKNAEREILKLNTELEHRVHQRTEQLELANRNLSEFAYVVSHDLKAPLRGVGQLAQWLAEDYADALNDDGRHKIDLMLGRVRRMYALIDGVLAYSRVGRVRRRNEAIDLGALVSEVIESLAPPEHIEIAIETELPTISADRTRIQQVFQNLLSNAMKFMDKPQGLVRIGCEDQGNFWRFWVSDNGPGIDLKYREKIFGIFQTLAPRDQQESTGVGLAVVKKSIELYGGQVWLESEIGQGSTFFFTLPKESLS